MGVQAKVGSFMTGTGIAGSTVAVTGVGFSPDFILFFYGGRSNVVNSPAGGTPRRGIGSAVRIGGGSTAKNQAAYTFSTNGGASTDTGAGYRVDGCVKRLITGLADGGILKVQSLDSDGFTLEIVTAFGSDLRIGYLALSGTDIQAVDQGRLTEPAAAGNVSVTGLTITPDAVFFLGIPTASLPTASQNDSRLMFGAACREDLGNIKNAVWCGGSDHGAATSQAMSYNRFGECIAQLNSAVTGINSRASVTSFNSDGFTLNFSEVTGSQIQFLYVVIAGGRWHMGSFNAAGDTTTTKVEHGLQFVPKAVLAVGSTGAEDAADTPHNDDFYCIGAFTSISELENHVILDVDNTAGGDVQQMSRNDSFYSKMDATPTSTIQTDPEALSRNAFSYVNSLNTPAATPFIWYIAVGDTARGIGMGGL